MLKYSLLLISVLTILLGCEGKPTIKTKDFKPEIISGYTLPPKPDPKVNDSTLLGIDSNNNGVRDDVERYIIKYYAKDPKYPKTKTAIALQYAKAMQYIFANNPANAYENKSYEKFDYAMDCRGYWLRQLNRKHNIDIVDAILDNDMFNDIKSKLFNTKVRTKAYFQFNGSLSGHMLGGGGGLLSSTKDKCETNIDTLGEW